MNTHSARTILTLVGCAVLLLTTGCIAAELLEAGALEAGAELGVASATEISAVDALVEGGFEMRATAGGSEVVSEAAIARPNLAGTLAEMAARNGSQLSIESGVIAFDGRALVFADDGSVVLRARGLADRVIGQMNGRGELFDLQQSSLPDKSVGRLRGAPRNATATARSEPAGQEPIKAIIRKGRFVDVLRIRDGWYEVRLTNGSGWVPGSELIVALVRNPSTHPSPSPWTTRGDSAATAPVSAVLDAYDHPNPRRCDGFDVFTCYVTGIQTHEMMLDTYTLSKRRVRQSHREARLLWSAGSAAVVELRERFTDSMTKDSEWGCVRILLKHTEQAGGWAAAERGSPWTCGQKSPWE